MANIKIKDMPDLIPGIAQNEMYLVVDEASKTYKILVKDIAIPNTSSTTQRQAVTYSAATATATWTYVSTATAGNDNDIQFNDNGQLTGFGSWNGYVFEVPGLNVQDRFTIRDDEVVIAPFTSAGFDGVRINIGEGTTSYKTMIQRVNNDGNSFLQLICDRTGGIEFTDSEDLYSRQVYAHFGPNGNRYLLLTKTDKGILLGDNISPDEGTMYYSSTTDQEVKMTVNGKTAKLISQPKDLNYTINSNLSTSGFDAYLHRNGQVSFQGTVDSTSATNEITTGVVIFTIDDIDARPSQDLFLVAPGGTGTWTATEPYGLTTLKVKTNGDVEVADNISSYFPIYRIWMDGLSFQSFATETI